MINDQREIRRKKRVIEYAENIGNVRKACRYDGVARSQAAQTPKIFIAEERKGSDDSELRSQGRKKERAGDVTAHAET